MVDIMDYLYGPLGKDWCLYFYILSIFYFIIIFIHSFFFIRYSMSKNSNIRVGITMVYPIMFSIFFYITMRILYGMCINSTK